MTVVSSISESSFRRLHPNTIEDEDTNKELPQFSGEILVAEDCKANQMLIVMMLEELGLHPDLAEDGKQAVEKRGYQCYARLAVWGRWIHREVRRTFIDRSAGF